MKKISTSMFLLLFLSSGAVAQELPVIAQWCYAATDKLKAEGYEYQALHDFLRDKVLTHFKISRAEAKITGNDELVAAAGIKCRSSDPI